MPSICTESKNGGIAHIHELVKIVLTKDKLTFDGFCSAFEANGYPQLACKLNGEGAFCPSVGGCVRMQIGCVTLLQ